MSWVLHYQVFSCFLLFAKCVFLEFEALHKPLHLYKPNSRQAILILFKGIVFIICYKCDFYNVLSNYVYK